MRIFIIGIGCKARQGKDSVANFIKELRPNVHILHFADCLYEEATNVNRKYPLIRQLSESAKMMYILLDDSERGTYRAFTEDEVPYLHQIFTERNITVYDGMNEKDPQILQFWGTQFRRAANPNYWVCRIQDKIDIIKQTGQNKDQDVWIAIADTRFKNEVNFVKRCGGYYVRVIRLNENGSQFIDPLRDPNHPSETDIINEIPFETLVAGTMDLYVLKRKTADLLERIEGDNYVSK